MSDLALVIQLLFVIDRIEPPWLIVEWTSSGETTELHQPLLPESAQEGEHWGIRIESRNNCTKESGLNTYLFDPDQRLIELPSALHLPTEVPYCIQFNGPL